MKTKGDVTWELLFVEITRTYHSDGSLVLTHEDFFVELRHESGTRKLYPTFTRVRNNICGTCIGSFS